MRIPKIGGWVLRAAVLGVAFSPSLVHATSCKPVLLDATPVSLKLTETISSASAHVGDTVPFQVVDPISVCGVQIIKQGALAEGTVTKAKKKASFGRAGKLNVNIDWVRMDDGEKVMLRAVKDVNGGSHTALMTGATVATAIVFFPAAPLFFFMHGKDITLPEGTKITAFTNADMPIKLQTFEPAPAQVGTSSPAGPSASSRVQFTTLQITSTPVGAQIVVDGNFVGDSPASIDLPLGSHTITLIKNGFQTWSQKLTSMGGKVSISATLKPTQATSH